jgi:AcrR family transcriptional regulator
MTTAPGVHRTRPPGHTNGATRSARHPARTQERILGAALREFAAKGLAGARVDSIARRARVNKRMLYHYFGDKEDLFRQILARKLRERAASVAAAPEDAAGSLAFWFDVVCRDRDWVRLMQWEALHAGDGRVLRETERRRAFQRGLEKLRGQQGKGLIASDLDPQHMLLSMMALTTFPVAFPQLTRLVTGRGPGDRAFQRQQAVFLRRLARSFGPEGLREVPPGRLAHRP